MWWIVPVGIVVYIIIRFVIDSNEQSSEMEKSGGMKVKYATLIDGLLQQVPNIKIQKETPTCIELSANFMVEGMSGTYYVFINHLFNNKLNVQIWVKPWNAQQVKLIDNMFEQNMPQGEILRALVAFMGL